MFDILFYVCEFFLMHRHSADCVVENGGKNKKKTSLNITNGKTYKYKMNKTKQQQTGKQQNSKNEAEKKSRQRNVRFHFKFGHQ